MYWCAGEGARRRWRFRNLHTLRSMGSLGYYETRVMGAERGASGSRSLASASCASRKSNRQHEAQLALIRTGAQTALKELGLLTPWPLTVRWGPGTPGRAIGE